MERKFDWEEAALFCEELATLAKMGMPWHEGVAEACADLVPRIDQHSHGVKRSLLGSDDFRGVGIDVDQLPRPLRAAIDVSVEVGEAETILSRLTPLLLRAGQWRRLVRRAWIYPLVTLLLAIFVWFGGLAWIVPRRLGATEHRATPQGLARVLVWLSEHLAWTGAGLLLGASVVGVAVWSLRRDRWIALPRRAGELGAVAFFLDVLAVFVSRRLPLPRALTWSASLVDDPRIDRDVKRMCKGLGDAVAMEEPKEVALGKSHRRRGVGLPARLVWLVRSAESAEWLAEELERLAGEYHERAEVALERATVWTPIAITGFVGGTGVLLAVLSVWVPYLDSLREALSR
ncbi:MAG TPA: hypothetical protein ENJ16_05765 [Planctomycetaceae bacterium]|nr:hypothetical protein [Planctomycetaceae bacterium]